MQFVSSASFWVPKFLVDSDWIEHAPFAFWLIEAHRPTRFVYVGTPDGYAMFAFNQAVLELGIKAQTVGIIKSPSSACALPESAEFQLMCAHNDMEYSDFSHILSEPLESAINHLSDGSIDLLHIDGADGCCEVQRTFESLTGKLSDRAVVLIHDTNVRRGNFGVHLFWDQIRPLYPHFEFLHGRGLGVLGLGKHLPDSLCKLFAAAQDRNASAEVRLAYSRLGRGLADHHRARKAAAKLAIRNGKVHSHLERLSLPESATDIQGQELPHGSAEADAENFRNRELLINRFASQTAALQREIKQLRHERDYNGSRLEAIEAELHETKREALRVRAAYTEAVTSTSWKITQPLRDLNLIKKGFDKFRARRRGGLQ